MATLTHAWTRASASLPLDWRLKGVVEGPREIDPAIRGQTWVAWARGGPNDERAAGEGGSAIAALLDLSNKLDKR